MTGSSRVNTKNDKAELKVPQSGMPVSKTSSKHQENLRNFRFIRPQRRFAADTQAFKSAVTDWIRKKR